MRRLLLLRHGVTEETGSALSGWTPDLHLSAAGVEQARVLAERLAPLPIDVLYASPLERCQETAAAVAEARGLEVCTLDDLGEVRYGDWTGQKLADLAKQEMWKLVVGYPSGARFPDGESLYEVQVRAVAAVERLRGAHAGQTVALCSHGDVIKALVAHYLGLHLDLFQRLEVFPASVTALAFTPVPRLLRLNDTGTNADLAPRPDPESPEAASEAGAGAAADPEESPSAQP